VIKIKNNYLSSNVQLLFVIAAIILFYILLKPLLNIFLASIILTYVFFPVYKFLKKTIKYDNLSVFLTLGAIVLIFLLPFIYIASQIPNQTENISGYVQKNLIDKGFFDISCDNIDSLKCNSVNFISGSGYFDFDKISNGFFKEFINWKEYIC